MSLFSLCLSCVIAAVWPLDPTLVLESIASAEVKNWDYTADEFNTLSTSILKQDDLELIDLLRRAHTNFNALSDKKAEPFTSYYKHYLPPAFSIPNIELTLDVQDDLVRVLSHLVVKRERGVGPLVLDGRGHKVLSVSVDGKPFPRESYRITPNELILLGDFAGSFTVEIQSEIDPFHNTELEGLYASGKFLTSQCESEGARRIFYTLDRPDVLSRITTTIIANPVTYPCRLSNGNKLEEIALPDGRAKIVWEDPIPKPSYLFAAVMGDFGRLEDHFITRSGRHVTLEVYVEKGKEERATFSLSALKEAMRFDEEFFDREYDLDVLKMVAISDFNMGAMENKGLMIFNEMALLVDKDSGRDANFRTVATVVAHEYFHNWSGNRVTVRNWFELALKEAFTDFRAMLFGEWMFGSHFIRPKDVTYLKENQFPEETSGRGHPIMVESYVSPRSIYDRTTYTKGREVFRTLRTYMDMLVPDGFRKAQNLYFERYDGQAVTFRELLSAANEILVAETGKNLSQFERWFDQQGTPKIEVVLKFSKERKKAELQITQSCPHPQTGAEQKPFLIPFSYELLRQDGTPLLSKQTVIFSEETLHFEIDADEKPVPIFMHEYAAPVIVNYPYTIDELSLLMKHATDPFSQWEAGQKFSLLSLERSVDRQATLPHFKEGLQSPHLSPLAKAQLLQTPTLKAMAQSFNCYDFRDLSATRDRFRKELASYAKPELGKLLEEFKEPCLFIPNSEQMQIRELRREILSLLVLVDPTYLEVVYQTYLAASDFETSLATFQILVSQESSFKEKAISHFYEKWKGDKMVFAHFLGAQSASPICQVSDLKNLMALEGFDGKNPNHVRSVLGFFLANLGQYHDLNGEGYSFMVDQIHALSKENAGLAEQVATRAFIDFKQLPLDQRILMRREIERLQAFDLPDGIRDLIQKIL
jgi:aminopeptidase N